MFKCGENEHAEPVKGSAGGLKTKQEAIAAALSDAAWTIFDAVNAIMDWATEDECPGECSKRRLPKPRFTVVTFATTQAADGTWSCDVDMKLTGYVRCAPDVEVALLGEREVPRVGEAKPVQKVLSGALPLG